MFWTLSWFVSGYWLGMKYAPKAPTAKPQTKTLPAADVTADADAMYAAAARDLQ